MCLHATCQSPCCRLTAEERQAVYTMAFENLKGQTRKNYASQLNKYTVSAGSIQHTLAHAALLGAASASSLLARVP